MDTVEKIREHAYVIRGSEGPDAIEKAAQLLKTASDIEEQEANVSKLKAERKKLEQDLVSSRNHLKDILTAVTPLLTTLILAGTLVFQILQSNQAAREKRQETERQTQTAEQARFTEALKVIQTSEKISPAATLLNTFTTEPYKSEARQMGIKLLLRANSADEFQDLFSSIFEPVTPVDLPILLQLNRSLAAQYNPIAFLVYDPVTHELRSSKIDAANSKAVDQLSAELETVSSKIGLILQGKRVGGAELNLSFVNFPSVNLKGANLSGANLSSAGFSQAILDGCDLSGITEFQNAAFYHTAWWHAARISPTLLNYLENSAPYRPNLDYPEGTAVSADDYAKNLARLRPVAETKS